MATRIQKAHSALLLRALAGRALKKLAPLYSDLKHVLDALQFEVQDHEQTSVASTLRFLKTTDGLIATIEKSTDKEFPAVDPSLDASKLDKKQLSKKVSKLLRDISKWSTATYKSLGKFDHAIGNDIRAFRDEAGMQAISFDDSLLPESMIYEKEAELVEEYRKLARIWHKLKKR